MGPGGGAGAGGRVRDLGFGARNAGGVLIHDEALGMDLGAYLRVSGSEQAKRATSIPFQLEVIESYCLRNGHRVVASYADEGVSGMSMNRPGLNRLLHDAEAGKFQAVITQDMTRWGRATEGIMVTQRLRDVGIRVIFASEGYGDTDDPYASEFNEDIGTAVAKKHVSDLAKFTPGRMVNGVLKGGKGIGGQPPFGYSAQYQVGSDGQPIVMNGRAVTKLVPNDHAPVVLKAFELYASGGSTRDVASLLRPERGLVMQASSVTRLLTNCRYYGANVIGKKQARKQRSGGTRTKYMPRETWTMSRLCQKNSSIRFRLDCPRCRGAVNVVGRKRSSTFFRKVSSGALPAGRSSSFTNQRERASTRRIPTSVDGCEV